MVMVARWSDQLHLRHQCVVYPLTMQGRNTVNCNIHPSVCVICDRACKNRPCECKVHRVIFLLISSIQNALSHFHKLQKKAH